MKNRPEKQDMLLDLSALNVLLQLLSHPAAFLAISNQLHTQSTLHALEESSPKTKSWCALGLFLILVSKSTSLQEAK